MTIKKMRVDALTRDLKQAKSFGLSSKFLCISLSCKHHCHLHGELITADKCLDIYDVNNVQDDCKCALSLILLDDNGDPLSRGIIEKVKSQTLNN